MYGMELTFLFQHSKYVAWPSSVFHSSEQEGSGNLNHCSFCVKCHLTFMLSRIFSFSLIFSNLNVLCLAVDLYIFILSDVC